MTLIWNEEIDVSNCKTFEEGNKIFDDWMDYYNIVN